MVLMLQTLSNLNSNPKSPGANDVHSAKADWSKWPNGPLVSGQDTVTWGGGWRSWCVFRDRYQEDWANEDSQGHNMTPRHLLSPISSNVTYKLSALYTYSLAIEDGWERERCPTLTCSKWLLMMLTSFLWNELVVTKMCYKNSTRIFLLSTQKTCF